MSEFAVPHAADLRKLAAASGLALDAGEVSAFQRLLPGLLAALDMLERNAEPPVPRPDGRRDPGRRPRPEEDPLNAIVRRCSVKGAATGKLAGKRIGLKDNVCVAGVPMTCGSRLLANYVPDIDATIVTRLLDAGAEIVAMLNMDRSGAQRSAVGD